MPDAAIAAPSKERRPSGRPVPRGWQAKFIDYVAKHGTFYRAAQHAGVSMDTVQRTRHADPAFDARCQDARELHADLCEEELQASANRADNPVGWIVRLKAIRPHQYIERHAIMSVHVNAEIAGPDAAQLLAAMLQCATPATAPMLASATTPALDEPA